MVDLHSETHAQRRALLDVVIAARELDKLMGMMVVHKQTGS